MHTFMILLLIVEKTEKAIPIATAEGMDTM
jgi:hypothetical protein